MTSRLADLPAELLQVITNYFGCSTLRLARSGDKRLHHKLFSAGGVVSVNLKDSSRRSVSRYPHMLDQFIMLTSLSISRGRSSLCGASLLWKHLSCLTLLESLDLTCEEAEEWLINEKCESLESRGSFERICGPSPLSANRCMPFGATFPCLRSLRLDSAKQALIDSDLACFPASLTSLHLPNNQALTLGCLKHFPGANLEHIWWGDYMSQTEKKLTEFVPPNIQTLDIHSQLLFLSQPVPWLHLTSITICTDAQSLRHLPKSLTYLDWYPCFDETSMVGFPESTIFPELKTLFIRLQDIEFEDPLTFPPTLSTLSISSALRPSSKCQRPLLQLPRSLKTLMIQLNSEFTLERLLEGLPDLTSLQLDPQREIDPSTFLLLPKSLTNLSVGFTRSETSGMMPIVDSIASSFLRHPLVSLLLNATNPLACSNFELLPRTLSTLYCYTIGDWTAKAAKLLPLSLTHLQLEVLSQSSQSSVEDEFTLHLPRLLQDLTLRCPVLAWNHRLISSLPPDLILLDIQGCSLSDDAISPLPRSLQYFSYLGENAPTGKAFKMFPRNLRYLDIFSAEIVSDDDIKHLPRYIKRLGISKMASHLSEGCIEFLPPGLTSFIGPDHIAQKFMSFADQASKMPANAIDPHVFKNSPSAMNDWY